ncbi:MAG: hypothetical protein ACOC02_01330 [Guyparkeria sp.]
MDREDTRGNPIAPIRVFRRGKHVGDAQSLDEAETIVFQEFQQEMLEEQRLTQERRRQAEESACEENKRRRSKRIEDDSELMKVPNSKEEPDLKN